MGKDGNEEFVYSVIFSEKTHLYGIVCGEENGNILEEIGDITENRQKIDDFCRMLNEEKIHPYHFYDVYEDFFG